MFQSRVSPDPAAEPGATVSSADHSAYATLAALDPRIQPGEARQLLLRRLVQTTRAEQVQFWRVQPGSSRLRPVTSWPPGVADDLECEPAQLQELPGVRDVALLREGDEVCAALTLASQRRRFAKRRRSELSDTANCLMVLHRREELQDRLRRQTGYTAQLAGEVLDSSRRLAGVRELERRRVAAQIVAFSQGRLGPLQAGIDRMLATPDQSLAAGEAAELRTRLDELIGDFRALVRGIHPQMLYRRGLRAALAEVADGAPVPVLVTGAVPARVDHEVAASLYYLAAAAVQLLTQDRAEVRVALGYQLLETGAAGLQMTLTISEHRPAAQLRAALTVHADRLGTLGGWVRVSGGNERLQVVAWVPDRLEPSARADLAVPAGVHARVRAQILELVARYAEGPGSARSRRLLSRLDEPVQVSLSRLGEAPEHGWWITETLRARPDLTLMPLPVEATPVSGSRLPPGGAENGPLDTVPDVIVRPSPQAPGERFEVLLPGAGVLCAGAGWRDLPQVLTTEVVARADLLRARTAVAAMQRLTRLVPPPSGRPELLELELAGLRAGTDELIDLEVRAGAQAPTLC